MAKKRYLADPVFHLKDMPKIKPFRARLRNAMNSKMNNNNKSIKVWFQKLPDRKEMRSVNRAKGKANSDEPKSCSKIIV